MRKKKLGKGFTGRKDHSFVSIKKQKKEGKVSSLFETVHLMFFHIILVITP